MPETIAGLLLNEEKLRSEADDLLYKRSLAELLKQYAPFAAVGSFATGLMVWRDLDIILDAPSMTVRQFFELGNRIAGLLAPWKMFFTDNRGHPLAESPKGLYWGIRLGDLQKGAWKIDLWAFGSEEFRRQIRKSEELKRNLNDQNRLTILSLKSQI